MLDNTDNQTAKRWSMPSLWNARDYISMMDARKKQIQDNQWASQQDERINTSLSLHEHWLATDDEELKKQYDKGSRMEEAAWMVSAFNGATWDFKKVIKDFIDENDDEKGSMYNAFYDYIQKGNMTTGQLADLTINKVWNMTYIPYEENEAQSETTYTPFWDTTISNVDNSSMSPSVTDRWGREYQWPYTDDEWTVVWDILWSIPWTVQNIWWLLESWIDKWLNKVWLMSDEQVENAEKLRDATRVEDYIPWINEDDLKYQTAQFFDELAVWIWMDIASWWTMTPELVAARRPWALRMLNFIKSSKWGERWFNLLWKGLWWMRDMFFVNTLEWEDTELSDLWWGALFNIALWRVFSKERADKRTYKWLMNRWPVSEMVNMLKEKWVDISAESIWEFVNKRFKWAKDQIVAQARKWGESAEKVLDALLSSVDTRFNNKTATNILKLIAEDLESKISAWWDKIADEIYQAQAEIIRSLIREWDNYTLSELKNIIRRLWDSDMSPFNKKFAEIKWTKLAETVSWWYREVKEFLEQKGEELWLWDLKNLNREIYTAYELAKWVMRKDFVEQMSNSMKERVSSSISWWLLWAAVGFLTWDTTKWAFVWTILNLGKKWWNALLKNTAFKTKFADFVYKVNGVNKQEILDWVYSEWKKKLSESADAEIRKMLENASDSFLNDIANYIYKDWFKDIKQEAAQWASDVIWWISVDIGE